MIDFNYTSQTEDGQIEFVNEKGETVRTYQLTELENFVIEQGLNDYYSKKIVSGSSWGGNPNFIEEEEFGYVPVNEWLDNEENFHSATEKFYNLKNPHEFVSANHEQQTIRRVG